MKGAQSGVVTMVGIATAVNIYGAVKKSKSVDVPILGGTIVAVALVALAGGKGSRISLAFSAAFLVTSLSMNGSDILALVNNLGKTGTTPGVALTTPSQNAYYTTGQTSVPESAIAATHGDTIPSGSSVVGSSHSPNIKQPV